MEKKAARVRGFFTRPKKTNSDSRKKMNGGRVRLLAKRVRWEKGNFSRNCGKVCSLFTPCIEFGVNLPFNRFSVHIKLILLAGSCTPVHAALVVPCRKRARYRRDDAATPKVR